MPRTLYSSPLSGHVHAVRLLLSMLDVEHEVINLQAAQGETRREAFLTINRFGQIPVLDHDGFVVRDSHAILVYLAKTYDPTGRWLPEEPQAAARVQEWLATSTLDLVIGPAWARAGTRFGRNLDVPAAQKRAARLLSIMDQHLAGRSWLASEHATIADLSCYPYVAMSEQGGVSREAFPQVQAWLQRVEGLPRFVPAPAPAG